MTTTDLPVRESNAILKAPKPSQNVPNPLAVDVKPDRVFLSLVIPRRDGQWEDYPKSYSVWKKATPELYAQVQRLQEGHQIWVKWTDKPAQREGTFYHDIVAIEKARVQEPTGVQPPSPAAAAAWDDTAPQNAPSGAPAAQGDTQGTNSYVDQKQASIEAQTAAKIAADLIPHVMPLDAASPQARLDIIKSTFAELTMIALAAIHEAQGQK